MKHLHIDGTDGCSGTGGGRSAAGAGARAAAAVGAFGLGTGVWKLVREELGRHGIEFSCCEGPVTCGCDDPDCCDPACCVNARADAAGGKADAEPGDSPRVKVVAVAPSMKDCLDAIGKTSRDQVVMVRVADETSQKLDAWVKTGAVKSRSEAAALFIDEGLKIRAEELDQLEDALREVDAARERLRKKAKDVLGN